MINYLKEKKGARRIMDKYQEEFRELLAHSPLSDLETKDGWFTWNNRRGGENLVASCIDRFLLLENFIRGIGEIKEIFLPTVGSDHWPISLN